MAPRLSYSCPPNALLLLIVAVSVFVVSSTQDKLCTYQALQEGELVSVDLSNLVSKTYYLVSGFDSSSGLEYIYYINICNSSTKCINYSYACRIDTASHLTGSPSSIADTYVGSIPIVDGVKLQYSSSSNKSLSTTISFSCGPGRGEPTLLFTDGLKFEFEWKTSLVCLDPVPVVSYSCTGDLNDDHYDLSPLSSTTHNWLADDSFENDTFAYHMNICQTLVNATALCKNGSSLCEVNSHSGVAHSLGTFSSLTITDVGHVSIQFKDGDLCPDTVSNETRHALLNLVCAPGINTPVLVDKRSSCSYVFEWQTIVACVKALPSVGDDCKVSDSFGDSYDFTSLTQDGGYDVGNSASVNFCGSVTCETASGVGLCVKDQSMGLVSQKVELLDDGDFLITLTQGGSCNPTTNYSTLIHMSCDPSADTPDITFSKSQTDPCLYMVDVQTSAACSASSSSCVLSNKATGDEFDLSPLTKYKSNWKLSPANTAFTYLINVCKPVVPSALGSNCSRSAGICQVPLDGTKPFSLGVPSAPSFDEENNIVLTYTGGDACHSINANRTTVIHLACGQDLGEPKYIGETSKCFYEFRWVTSAACPLAEAVGDDCSVVDKFDHYEYDFSPLKNISQYTVDVGDISYVVAVCHPTKDTCSEGAGACMATSDDGKAPTYEGLAVYNDNPIIDDGDIQLVYTGTRPCGVNGTARVEITFVCDESRTGLNNADMIFVNDFDDCLYQFTLRTSLACKPTAEPVECVVVGKDGASFDLSRLYRIDANYRISDFNTSFIYELNICGPLVMPKNMSLYHCPPNAAGCQFPLSDADRSPKSIGVPSDLAMDASTGRPYLLYTGGRDGCHGNYSRSTRIDFFCIDDSSKTKFEYLGENDECMYMFAMYSTIACPVKTTQFQGCLLTDPDTGYEVDLSPLGMQAFNISGSYGGDNYTFSMVVCAQSGVSVSCNESAAVCQSKPSDESFVKTLGYLGAELTLDGDQVSIVYTQGDYCNHAQTPRSARIDFTCDPEADPGTPKFVSESDNCTYYFTWATKYVCFPQFTPLDCSVVDPDTGCTYDLSSLIRNDQNWPVSDDREGGKYSYLINICRSLVPQNGTDCGLNAAACQLVSNSSSYDIGLPAAPQIDDSGNIFVEYSGGEMCKNGPRTLRIDFKCGTSLGFPEFLKEIGCTYYLVWTSNAACPLQQAVTSACNLTDSRFGSVDLSPLSSKVFSVNVSSYTYNIKVCGALTCSGSSTASACQNEGNVSHVLGDVSTQSLELTGGNLELTYEGGSYCNHAGVNRSIVIDFDCGKTDSEPVFVNEDGCVYFFQMSTPHACPTVVERACQVTDPSTSLTYDLSGLTVSTYWTTFSPDANTVSYKINVCRTIAGSPGCDGFGACRVTSELGKTPVGTPLGFVSSPTVVDGEVYLIYTVADPNSPCGNYTAKIHFVCPSDASSSLNAPQIVSEDEASCSYSFQWQTTEACPTNSPSTPPPPVLSQNCSYYDPRQKTYFDLKTLFSSSTDEQMDHDEENEKHYLRVCAPASHCPSGSSSCSVLNADLHQIDNGKFTRPPYMIGDTVVLEYTSGENCPGGNTTYNSTIIFECDRDAGRGKPVHEHELGPECNKVFRWVTSYVCAPIFVPCTVSGFDLTPLRSLDQNWQVTSHTGHNYHTLSVCRTLVPGLDTAGCGSSAYCHINATVPTATHGMGLPASPTISEGGDLVLVLPGSPTYKPPAGCSSFSVVVTFSCLPGVLGKPVLVDEGDCVHQVEWESYAGCPVIPQVGDNCKVKDSESGLTFDLSPLKSIVGKASDSNHNSYALKVCGNFGVGESSCSGSVASCMTPSGSGSSTSFGFGNSRLIFSDGDVHLHYEDGPSCGGSKYNQSTVIRFVCDPNAGLGSPKYLQTSSECTAVFEWPTNLVCRYDEDTRCYFYLNNGTLFDLSALSKKIGNWEIYMDADQKKNSDGYNYVINVCHSLNDQVGLPAGCDGLAGACQYKNGSYYSLGGVVPPTVENGGLVMHYQHGDMCKNNIPRTLTLQFECDDSSDFNLGRPEFQGELSTCNYLVKWRTSEACPSTPVVGSSSCSVTDSKTKQVYDLSALNNAKSLSLGDGTQYYLNPCQNLTTPCSANGCQSTSQNDVFSMGYAQKLTLEDGALSLDLLYGDYCKSTKFERSAHIDFLCDRTLTSGKDVLKFNNEDQCHYSFTWSTSAVCSAVSESLCLVYDDRTKVQYNIDALNNGVFKDKDGTSYYFSTCKSLPTNYCGPNAGFCKKGPSDASAVVLATTGTQSDPEMSADYTGVLVKYAVDTGSCQGTATITMVCSPNGEQPPTVKNIGDCSYIIEWKTCLVCADQSKCRNIPTTATTTSTKHNAGPGTTTKSPVDRGNSSGKSSGNGGVIAGILVPMLVVLAVVAFVMYDPERRRRVRACLGIKNLAPSFQYKKVALSTTPQSTNNLFNDSDDDDEEQLLPL